jgi:hypothetical protein
MGDTLNPVVALAESEGLALAYQNPQMNVAVATVMNASGRGPSGGVAVFYSGIGADALAQACVTNLNARGVDAYTYRQTQSGITARLQTH